MNETTPNKNCIDLLITGIGQLISCAGDRNKGAEAALGIIENASIACSAGRIVYAGNDSEPEKAIKNKGYLLNESGNFKHIDAGGLLVSPGFVDPHTHLAFAGERSAEFALRCAGATYLEIMRAGGGIIATVKATREASEDELVRLCIERLERFAAQGVTTVEVKSGYGLSVEEELKLLRAIKKASMNVPIKVESTLLGAHALSPEYRDQREKYVDLVCSEMVPAAAETGLARFVDIFVEEGAYTPEDARKIAKAAYDHGLGMRLHVDQLTAGGGAELAADLKALTADHLEQISPEGIKALADSGTCAGLLPTATLYTRLQKYAPGRLLSDAGACLALGTNCNPGSAMTENHSLALGLACLNNGLTPAEALLAATDGSARSLSLGGECGRIAEGSRADIIIHRALDYRHLAYHLAVCHASVVIAGGVVIKEEKVIAPCLG